MRDQRMLSVLARWVFKTEDLLHLIYQNQHFPLAAVRRMLKTMELLQAHYFMLCKSSSGPEIGLPGRISAGF